VRAVLAALREHLDELEAEIPSQRQQLDPGGVDA
jgi:hypothetical protein